MLAGSTAIPVPAQNFARLAYAQLSWNCHRKPRATAQAKTHYWAHQIVSFVYKGVKGKMMRVSKFLSLTVNSYSSSSGMGLRPKSIANLCHPGHTKMSRRAATSQLNERSFIVGLGIDFSLFSDSIKKAIWAISTSEVTALDFVLFEPLFFSLHARYVVCIFL